MANDNPNPIHDASQIEVLLAGNIADDDLMWVVRCSVEELHRLFQSPVSWVAGLGSLPGWVYYGSGEAAPEPVLTRDFAMLVQTTETPDPDGWVVVQGIAGTNEITVLASWASAVRSALATDKVAAATAAALGTDLATAQAMTNEALRQAGGEPFGPFWDEVARDPNNPPSMKRRLPVNVVRPAQRFYAHLEILDKGESPAQTAQRIATFALANALDPKGYGTMLDGLDQETLYVDRASAEKGDRISILEDGAPSVVYANVDGGSDAADQDAQIACEFVDGRWVPAPGSDQGGSGNPNGAVLKRWGVEDGEPVLYPNG